MSTNGPDETGGRELAIAPASEVNAVNGNDVNDQRSTDENIEAMARRTQKHHKKWNRRMKIFFCCLGYKKNKDSIADVASVFAEFYSDLNVPSSGIAAGFVLLSKYQAAQREWILKNDKKRLGIDQYLSNIPVREDTKFIDISTAQDSHLINDLIYYMNYSLAIFGWPLQMMDDPCMLCCIYPYLRISPCCSSRRQVGRKRDQASGNKEEKKVALKKKSKSKGNKVNKLDVAHESVVDNDRADQTEQVVTEQDDQSKVKTGQQKTIPGQLNDDCDAPIILEDNCCSCNAASAERRLAQHNYEIIYISYKSTVNVVPFLVAADHSKRTIVVAIRGSMSLSDMVTDMNGTVDKLPIDDCPDDWLCHRGITSAASYVKATLLREHILDRAFNCRPDLGSNDYQLLFCGHSLGAGAAAILGILMRKQYPNLKAYLYSPPGGILSMPAVEYTKEFAYGIILGNDTVARLGVAQLERLRYHILLSLDSTRKSSSHILARALCPSMCFGSNKVDYDPEHSLDLLHGVGGRSFELNGTKIPFQSQPQVLYVPGRLIHVVKNYSFKSKTRRLFNGPIYQAIWTDNSIYDRVLISEGMFFDHLPLNLMHSMKMLFSNTLPGRSESKQSTSLADAPVAVTTNQVPVAEPKHEQMKQLQAIDLTRPMGDPDDSDSISESKLAQLRDVMEIDDNNNNNDDVDHEIHNNVNSDRNNNQPNAKIYPILKQNLESDIKRGDCCNSQISLEGLSINKESGGLDENGNEKV